MLSFSMDRTQALRILKDARAGLQARGVRHAALFGSLARGQSHAWSDIDVLVTPEPGRRFDLFDLGAIQSLLDDAFRGYRVDVVFEPIRSHELKDTISRDSVHAF
mgnify:CR=1 FL=1